MFKLKIFTTEAQRHGGVIPTIKFLSAPPCLRGEKISKAGILLFLQVFFLQISLPAQQPAGFSPVKDEKSFRENFAQAGKKIETIQSDFTQEKNLSMLEEKIVSKGQFFFKKEKKVRLEYSSPYKYLMIINGDNVTVQDDKKTNRFSARSNKMFRQINEIIVDCLSGTALGSPNYSVKAFENKSQYALLLTPTSKTLKEFFKDIRVYIDRKDYAVAKVEMNELSGDNTVMHFSRPVLNQALGEEKFEVKN